MRSPAVPRRAETCDLLVVGSGAAGLYAVGNDMASMMGGRYPAGGITLGQDMTFGYVAAHHAGGRASGET